MKCKCGHLEIVHVGKCFSRGCPCGQYVHFERPVDNWDDMVFYAWIWAIPMSDDELLDTMELMYDTIKEENELR
jgi:hypothetical protein